MADIEEQAHIEELTELRRLVPSVNQRAALDVAITALSQKPRTPDPRDAAVVKEGLSAILGLVRKAARYDWLAQGGIYRIGFDSTGGVSLEQWDRVIDELMDREDGNGR